jgi:hypothetical protein
LADSVGILDLKLNRIWQNSVDSFVNWFVAEVGIPIEGEDHLRFLVVEHVKDYTNLSFEPEA